MLTSVAFPGIFSGAVPAPPAPPAPAPSAQPPVQPQPNVQTMTLAMQMSGVHIKVILFNHFNFISCAGPQSFDQFMGQFGNNAIMPQNGDPRILFANNLGIINSMNVLFLQGALTFSVAVNAFAALSFEEFAQRQGGMGLFANNSTANPLLTSRGNLRFGSRTSLNLDLD